MTFYPLPTIGFFGGSFDPIHFGHISLIIEMFERRGLDHILVCPALVSPTKQERPPIASPEHRANMVRVGLEDLPFCELYEAELYRASPSYTIDTIKNILAVRSERIMLILAEDVACDLDKWKNYEELLELTSPLIGTRLRANHAQWNRLPKHIRLKLQQGKCHIPTMDIDSTTIRKRLQKNLYCGHLLPQKVLDYIYRNKLYSDF